MPTAAEALLPLIQQLCNGEPPLRVRCWDGSEISPGSCATSQTHESAQGGDATTASTDAELPALGATLIIKSPTAMRRILWQPNELGFSRAYVAGEIEVEGGIWQLFQLQALLSHADRPSGSRARLEAGRRLVAAARAAGDASRVSASAATAVSRVRLETPQLPSAFCCAISHARPRSVAAFSSFCSETETGPLLRGPAVLISREPG